MTHSRDKLRFLDINHSQYEGTPNQDVDGCCYYCHVIDYQFGQPSIRERRGVTSSLGSSDWLVACFVCKTVWIPWKTHPISALHDQHRLSDIPHSIVRTGCLGLSLPDVLSCQSTG
ncbi:hypothetical protein Tco_1335624 [Tanacetum coccineum]